LLFFSFRTEVIQNDRLALIRVAGDHEKSLGKRWGNSHAHAACSGCIAPPKILPDGIFKRLVKSGMGFFSLETAWRTLQGYEAMNRLRKGQVQEVNKGDSSSQAAFIARLFGVAV